VACLLLMPFFLLAYAGVESSNDPQPEQYDPIMDAVLYNLEDPTVISTGLIQKIIVAPIGFGLGVAMILIAGPVLGGSWLAARSPRYKRLANRLMKNGRSDLDGIEGLSYVISVSGLLLIFIGVIRQTYYLNAIGGVLILLGLLLRGQLESVRVAASTNWSRRESVRASSTNAMKGNEGFGGEVRRNSAQTTSEPTRSQIYDQDSEPDSVPTKSPQTEAKQEQDLFVPASARDWYENFIHLLIDAHGATLSVIRSRITQLDFEKKSSPVTLGRRYLLLSFSSSSGEKLESFNPINLKNSIQYFDAGCIHPDNSEWPLDSAEIGRAHACLWGGIARTFTRRQAPFIMIPDAEKSDTWFATAAIVFLEQNEPLMAGRTFQEWGESRRLMGDYEHADSLFFAAYISFVDAKNDSRARIAMSRHGARQSCAVDSSFFLNRPPTLGETDILTTILGGKNSEQFYSSVK